MQNKHSETNNIYSKFGKKIVKFLFFEFNNALLTTEVFLLLKFKEDGGISNCGELWFFFSSFGSLVLLSSRLTEEARSLSASLANSEI